MTAVRSLSFKDAKGQTKKVEFLKEQAVESSSLSPFNFQTTIVTGQNGSSKSTLLNKLVAALVLPEQPPDIQLDSTGDRPTHVICLPGTAADRFPPKERAGGGRTEFDIPRYSYLGQRVGTNLLSKKRPLETMLSFALDEEKAERFTWEFFPAAHEFAGIHPYVEYELLPKRRSGKARQLDLLGAIQAMSRAESLARDETLPPLTQSTAEWLLNTFTYETFNALQQLLIGRKKVVLKMGRGGAEGSAPVAAMRLGLLLDVLSLTEAKVHSLTTNNSFSIYELSSGEFHMFTSLLSLGFGMEEFSVVLIDEPENNLHPQWQRNLMEHIFSIGARALTDGHIIVSTHSPLVVNSAVEGSTIVDLTYDELAAQPILYGASADEVLLTQFGVGSSRTPQVVDTVQHAVFLVEQGDFDSNEFKELLPQLQTIRESLSPSDPMTYVLAALVDDEEVPRP